MKVEIKLKGFEDIYQWLYRVIQARKIALVLLKSRQRNLCTIFAQQNENNKL